MKQESKPLPQSQTYLLRVWRVEQEQGDVWLALVERAGTGKRKAFPDLQTMFRYLEAECRDVENGGEREIER